MTRLFVLFALICSPLAGQTLKGPTSVANGEAIHLAVELGEGDLVTWRLLHPRGVPVKQIRTSCGTDFVVDPPIGYAGTVEVLMQVINWDTRRFVEDEIIVQVGKVDDVDPVDPPPVDPPIPDPGYDGPNEYGVGQVSYDAAPGYSAAAVEIFNAAAEHLYGRPSVKVLFTDDPRLNSTDYNVHVWIVNQVRSRLPGEAWTAWRNKIYERLNSLQRTGLTIDQWYSAFKEAAAGVQAHE